MKIYEGKAIVKGIAIGKIKYYVKEENIIVRNKVYDVEKEITRYEAAKREAEKQLEALYEKAFKEVGKAAAEIFLGHSMILEDEEYNESVQNIIDSQRVNAEYAVAITGDNFSQIFADMDNEYFRVRSADVKDISERVISILLGKNAEQKISKKPAILLADDITPSEMIQMDKSMFLAVGTRLGSEKSHTAILARAMAIPAVFGIDAEESMDGAMGIVDGCAGKLIVSPSELLLEEYKKRLTSLRV